MERILFTLFLLSIFNTSAAQPGVLDQTFGIGGKVIIPADSTAVTKAVVIQPDGKIISGTSTTINNISYLTLIRYNTNGSFDNTFGINGRINVRTGSFCSLGDIALQTDGKIVVGGNVLDTISNSNGAFLLMRYLPNGTPDSTFGYNGIVKTFPQTTNSLSLTTILIKPDGKIVAGGSISGNNFTEYPFVKQYLPNGQSDNSFNSNAFYINLPYGDAKSVSDMIGTADGKIIISVEAKIVPANNSSDFLIARLLPNGSPDSSFGKNGINYTDFSNSSDLSYGITMLPDSSLVLSGSYGKSSYYYFAMVKFTPNGKVDSTFGTNGKVTTRFSGKSAGASKITTDPTGKLIVCGYAYSGLWSGNAYDFALAVYRSNGSLDSSFGRNGLLTTDFANSKDYANALAIQADGKIVLAGDSYNGHITSIALARYEPNQFLKYNTLQGNIFYDQNKNGIKDANEPNYNNSKLVTYGSLGNDSIITFTANGKFSIDVDTGYYNTRFDPLSPYYNFQPISQITHHSTYFNTDSISFAVQPIPNKRDLSITAIPLNNARPGFPLAFEFICKNEGTDTTNAIVKIVLSNKTNQRTTTPSVTTQNGDTLQWIINNLKPQDSLYIRINSRVSNTANIGDTLYTVAGIQSTGYELTPLNNSYTIKQIVTGSYDPNDKSEIHGGTITTKQVANGEYLQYMIRFQNVGNDTAFNVYIRDTLDNELDWSTMQVIASSHNYQLVLTNGNKCFFAFRNIKLVDSNRNEPSSHGYIVYRIKPKPTVTVGDEITNRAYIYFDYNVPVITNTELTMVVNDVLPLRLIAFNAKKENNKNLLQWSTVSEKGTDRFEIERSPNGYEYTTIGAIKAGSGTYDFTDNHPLFNTNYYRLKIIDRDGRFEYSPVRSLINTSSSLKITVYPNPAKDKLQLQLENERQSTVNLQIFSQEGKLVLSEQVNAQQGVSLHSIIISQLATGHYFLKATGGEKQTVIVKFEKAT